MTRPSAAARVCCRASDWPRSTCRQCSSRSVAAGCSSCRWARSPGRTGSPPRSPGCSPSGRGLGRTGAGRPPCSWSNGCSGDSSGLGAGNSIFWFKQVVFLFQGKKDMHFCFTGFCGGQDCIVSLVLEPLQCDIKMMWRTELVIILQLAPGHVLAEWYEVMKMVTCSFRLPRL